MEDPIAPVLEIPMWGACLALIWLALNTGFMIFLWRRLKRQRILLHALHTMAQRQDRDIAQQRYAIAMVRQLTGGGDPADQQQNRTEEEVMADAVKELEDTVQTLSPEIAPDVSVAKAHDPSKALKMSDTHILQSVHKALKENRIAISRQPVVVLPDRDVRYYEVFSRIHVGEEGFIPAQSFISVAKNNRLIAGLDNVLLLRCLQMIKATSDKKPAADYFINISAQTLGNKNYIRSLVDFLAINPKLATRLVFEITQEDSMNLSGVARNVMENLALLGCRFSMDQIKMLGMDVDRLLEQSISFVKLDARGLQKEMDNMENRKRIRKIKNTLDGHGIQTILEKVENEKQFFTMLDLCIDLGQGYFFGQPELLE